MIEHLLEAVLEVGRDEKGSRAALKVIKAAQNEMCYTNLRDTKFYRQIEAMSRALQYTEFFLEHAVYGDNDLWCFGGARDIVRGILLDSKMAADDSILDEW